MASHIFTTVVSTTTLASQTSSSSSTFAPTLHARMNIPSIGEVPTNDPLVYISLIILLSMVVLAFLLVCCVQRRSSREVWATVEPKDAQGEPAGKFKHLRHSSRFLLPSDSERPSWDAGDEMEQGLVRINHRIPMSDSEYGSDTDSDDEELSDEEGNALAGIFTTEWVQPSDHSKTVSRDLTRTPSGAKALDNFEHTFDQLEASVIIDSVDGDLGVTPKQKQEQRASMTQRQFIELHLKAPSVF